MVKLHWPRNTTFTDRERDEQYDGPVTTDVADDAEEQYLDRGWEYPDDVDDENEAEEESAYGNPTTDRDTLETMSYDDLRKHAAESDRGDVNGGSSKDDIIDAFAADDNGA